MTEQEEIENLSPLLQGRMARLALAGVRFTKYYPMARLALAGVRVTRYYPNGMSSWDFSFPNGSTYLGRPTLRAVLNDPAIIEFANQNDL